MTYTQKILLAIFVRNNDRNVMMLIVIKCPIVLANFYFMLYVNPINVLKTEIIFSIVDLYSMQNTYETV